MAVSCRVGTVRNVACVSTLGAEVLNEGTPESSLGALDTLARAHHAGFVVDAAMLMLFGVTARRDDA